MKKLRRNAYVSPSVADFVVVYDEEIEADLSELSNLAIQISIDFSCLTFAILLYDGSYFCHELYKNGNLLDEYNSSRLDLFPEGGDSQKLCTAFDVKQSINRVRPILGEPSTESIYVFGSTRHKMLVKELGLSEWSTDIIGGYQYIAEGEIDAVIFDEDNFPDLEATLSMLGNTF